MRGNPWKLIKNYLSDKSQTVRLNYYTSLHLPQRSALASLSSIYVYNLWSLELYGQLVSYADDAALYVEASGLNVRKLNTDQESTVG